MERAWQALQSPHLVPAQVDIYKTSQVWIPVKRLVARARRRREDEVERLKRNHIAAMDLEKDDYQRGRKFTSNDTFPTYSNNEEMRRKWRELVELEAGSHQDAMPSTNHGLSAPYKSPYAPPNLTSMLEAEQGMAVDTNLWADAAGDDILDFDWNAWLENARDM